MRLSRPGGVDISLAEGWIEVASIVHPPGEVVVGRRTVSVFALHLPASHPSYLEYEIAFEV